MLVIVRCCLNSAAGADVAAMVRTSMISAITATFIGVTKIRLPIRAQRFTSRVSNLGPLQSRLTPHCDALQFLLSTITAIARMNIF